MPKQVCVVLRGLPAVGKTTLAKALARRLHFVYLSKDDVRNPTLTLDKETRSRLCARGVPDEVSAIVDSNSACYEVVSAIAKTQFEVGALGCVLDGPGYGRTEVLAELLSTLSQRAAVVVVNCSLDRNLWLQRLAERKSGLIGGSIPAHSHPLACDADAIEAHYPNGLSASVPGIAVEITVDCGQPISSCAYSVIETLKRIHAA